MANENGTKQTESHLATFETCGVMLYFLAFKVFRSPLESGKLKGDIPVGKFKKVVR